jgi:hypothetical protein
VCSSVRANRKHDVRPNAPQRNAFVPSDESPTLFSPAFKRWEGFLDGERKTAVPLKAKSPGSSPGNATKKLNKINSLKENAEGRSFVFFVLVALWWHFCREM